MKESKQLRLIGQGKTEYLNDIARTYYDDIYRFCCFQTGNRELAYDLAQETFLRFIRYADHYRGGNVKGYLLTVAMNVCRDYWNKSSRRKEQELPFGCREEERPAREACRDSTASREDESSVDDRIMLQKALLALPDFQREAIVLHYYYDFKYHEIGKMTGVGVSTVKSRIRQGCQKLKELL